MCKNWVSWEVPSEECRHTIRVKPLGHWEPLGDYWCVMRFFFFSFLSLPEFVLFYTERPGSCSRIKSVSVWPSWKPTDGWTPVKRVHIRTHIAQRAHPASQQAPRRQPHGQAQVRDADVSWGGGQKQTNKNIHSDGSTVKIFSRYDTNRAHAPPLQLYSGVKQEWVCVHVCVRLCLCVCVCMCVCDQSLVNTAAHKYKGGSWSPVWMATHLGWQNLIMFMLSL